MCSIQQRFWSKVALRQFGCYEWLGGKTGHGYGGFWLNSRMVPAHRFAYEGVKGSIPPHAHIDHLCRNPGCVNPDHLEAVSARENTYRGVGPSAKNKQKTHCKRGHELTPDNIQASVYQKSGKRYCLVCLKHLRFQYKQKHPNWQKRYYSENKEQIQAKQRLYREANREKILAQKRMHYAEARKQ